jgi:myo-inositol-1(or 4)-monophosphatase
VSVANPDELLEVAVAAARAAGGLLRERAAAGGVRALATKSSPTDVVSEADVAAEQAIREVLDERRPGDAVLGEEGGVSAGESGLRWIVDPLDGTTNFLYGNPQWAVSVGVHDEAGAVAGAVLDPLRDELFVAARGGEARLGDEVLRGGDPGELGAALVGTGFGYDAAVRERQAAVLAALLPRVRDVRRAGAAALDLAWTAAGRLDAYFERGVQPWDTAAGALLCERAGLAVIDLPAQDGLPAGILVAPPGLAEELTALVLGR